MFMRSLCGVLLLGSVLLACGSSTSSPGTGTDSGAPSGACDPVAFATLNSAGSNAKVCPAFIQCMGDKCSAAAQECAGPDYSKGVYAGTCGSYYDCVKTCNCVKTCVDKCIPDTSDCSACLLYTLGYGCTLPCASAVTSCGS